MMGSSDSEEQTLVEVPFYSHMPDTSANTRFTDSRKAKFIREVLEKEAPDRAVIQRETTTTTSPAPGFVFRASLAKKQIKPPFDCGLPYAVGPGPTKKSVGRIFVPFNFNQSSSALSSRAYGHFYSPSPETVARDEVTCSGISVRRDQFSSRQMRRLLS